MNAYAPHPDWPTTQIPPVILRDTRPDDWPELRRRIEARLRVYLGERPPSAASRDVQFEETGRDQWSGLTRIAYRYHVLDEAWTEAYLLLPPDFQDGERRAAVTVIHGTSDLGKMQTMSEKELPRRHYAVELARRGFITFAPDLFGYGPPFDSVNRWDYFEDFDRQYPQWSQADRSVFGLQRGLDVLDRLPMTRPGQHGAMGISLGGDSTIRLMAADPRIQAAVAHLGVSPQATNIFRLLDRQRGARAAFDAVAKKTGRVPYEVTDLLALCAPRALMLTETFDDPYNPDITASFQAIRNAWMAWNLLDAPDRVSLLVHGDRHDTVDDVRDASYRWMERWLPARP